MAAATAAVVGVTLLDYLTGQHLSRESNGRARRRERTSHRHGQAITVRKAITVQRPREEVYRFWRDFSNLPRFMEHLESVQVLDDRRSHWKARAPAGSSVEWDAEITEERENEFIAWRSLQHADVDNWGSVQFVDAPGDRGTEVHVKLRYEPPGGKLASIVAKLFGEEPGQQVAVGPPAVQAGDGLSAEGRVEGEDPLAHFSPHAPKHLLRTDGFDHVGDIMVGSFYDSDLDEGCAFEELISFHGGIGGLQTRPFILHPQHLEVPPGPILGAASVHGILARWRQELQAERHAEAPR